jgi:hypothetical protein
VIDQKRADLRVFADEDEYVVEAKERRKRSRVMPLEQCGERLLVGAGAHAVTIGCLLA